MGRRKIEIEPLSDERNRSVTFVKRKAGLFKKAYELSVLCEVDLAVIIVGNNNKVYEFSSVDTNELLNSYRIADLHESKLLENYGRYKKRSHLKSWPYSNLNDDSLQDLQDDNCDSDDESEVSDSKRQKRDPVETSNSLYSQQSSVSSRFAHLAGQKQLNQLDQDISLHRPILRVQIPTDNKTVDNLDRTVSLMDGMDRSKDKAIGGESTTQSLQQNAIAYSLRKYKGSINKKPPLPLPTNKLQTLSPLSASHPIPGTSGAPFYSLPPPSPSGNFAPSILPTPVFNLVFNSQFINPMNGVGNTQMPLSAGCMNGPVTNSSDNPNNGTSAAAPSSSSQALLRSQNSDTAPQSTSGSSSNLDIELPKFKPPLHQQSTNGEQTPISGLPSRYMNDIFPSPSNFYASQEWPTGMTPYSSSMSHYFVGMVPSATGATPLQLNQAYASSSRNIHPSGTQKQGPSLSSSALTVVPVGNRARKPSQGLASDGMGQYFKR